MFLPDDAGLELDAAVGGGQMRILGEFEEGTNLEARQVVDGDGPQFVLDLEAGLGIGPGLDPADGDPTAMTRHPADLISLTFGLLFAAIGVLLLFGRIDDLRLDWVLPAATVVLGVLLIVRRPIDAIAAGRRADRGVTMHAWRSVLVAVPFVAGAIVVGAPVRRPA